MKKKEQIKYIVNFLIDNDIKSEILGIENRELKVNNKIVKCYYSNKSSKSETGNVTGIVNNKNKNIDIFIIILEEKLLNKKTLFIVPNEDIDKNEKSFPLYNKNGILEKLKPYINNIDCFISSS